MKNLLQLFTVVFAVLLLVTACSAIKYSLWRAEHPNAKTWTFFIPSRK